MLVYQRVPTKESKDIMNLPDHAAINTGISINKKLGVSRVRHSAPPKKGTLPIKQHENERKRTEKNGQGNRTNAQQTWGWCKTLGCFSSPTYTWQTWQIATNMVSTSLVLAGPKPFSVKYALYQFHSRYATSMTGKMIPALQYGGYSEQWRMVPHGTMIRQECCVSASRLMQTVTWHGLLFKTWDRDDRGTNQRQKKEGSVWDNHQTGHRRFQWENHVFQMWSCSTFIGCFRLNMLNRSSLRTMIAKAHEFSFVHCCVTLQV